MKKQLKQILGHYGPEAQKKKSIEELSELITLLAREQTGRVSEGELIEEIADSYNMLGQLVMIYGIKEEVKAIRKAKIERTLDQINEVDCGYINVIPNQTKTRYTWDEAPEWAMWGATDVNGDMNWYDFEPSYDNDDYQWLISYGEHKFFTNEGPCENWKETLEARPK